MTDATAIANVVVTERDIEMMDRLVALTNKLTKGLPPDQLLSVIEDMMFENAQVAACANSRVLYGLNYIQEHDLWQQRTISEEGKTHQEFETFADYAVWAMSYIKEMNARTALGYMSVMRFLRSFGISEEKIIGMIAHPSRMRAIMPLFELDGSSRFEGFASDDVLARMRSEIGAGEDEPAEEVARDFVEKVGEGEGSASEIAARVAGGWAHIIEFYDDKSGGGPRLVVRGWDRAGSGRYKHTFVLADEKPLHSQAKIMLEKHRGFRGK
jgi:hypothetical protein